MYDDKYEKEAKFIEKSEEEKEHKEKRNESKKD